MKELTQVNWHELPTEQAAARLRQFGPNQMTAQKRLIVVIEPYGNP